VWNVKTLPINYPTQSSTEGVWGRRGKKISQLYWGTEKSITQTQTHRLSLSLSALLLLTRVLKYIIPKKQKGHIALEVSLLHLLHLKLMLHNSQIKKKTCVILPLYAFILLNHTHVLQHVTYSTSTHRIMHNQHSSA